MATKVYVELIDDIDGSAASETVTFGVDGKTYEIDLSEQNAAALRESLATWVSSSRRVGKASKAANAAARRETSPDVAKVRQWARENGHTISDRGRVSAEVRQAYVASH